MTVTDPTEPAMPASRRVVLGGVAVIGAGAVLSACGGGAEGESRVSGADQQSSGEAPTTAAAAKSADVPVGGGLIAAEAKAVITQPTAGTFHAFSVTCTHKGCPVTKVEGETIVCSCHGSEFSTADGSVVKGPATTPLKKLTVTENGGELFVS